MRSVKIVATIGPATSSRERIQQLLRAGVDTVRLNFSHGMREEHAARLETVREVSNELGKHVAVLQDLQGPRIRTTGLRDGETIALEDGAELVVAGDDTVNREREISTSYPALYRHVSPGSRILLDDGRLTLEVVRVVGQEVRCRVVKGGLLGANKGVNLPGAQLDIASFTEKDKDDLEFGLGLGVDWVAMSFVQMGDDARPVREAMKRRGVRVPLMAKIERPAALSNLDGILNAFDGIMVARGDLGVELSPEEVPIWQKEMVHRARERGKLVIVATQMLESMMDSPRPTRAEASDVANAVLDGADAVMLSGETAMGSYPVETVAVMSRIIEKAQTIYQPRVIVHARKVSSAEAVAHAASSLAQELGSKVIVVLTRSGATARLVSKSRPPMPVLALTRRADLARQLAPRWGVTPVVADFPSGTQDALSVMEDTLLARGTVERGESVVVVGSTPFAQRGRTNFVKAHRVIGRT